MKSEDTHYLRQSLKALADFSDAEWELVVSCLQIKTFEKGELLLKAGDVCRSLLFLLSGTIVYYYLNDRGDEITTDFAFDGNWVTDNRSRLSATPSHLNIKAIEKVKAVSLSQTNLDGLYSRVPQMEHIGRILIEQAYVRLVQLSLDLQILSAEERYLKLCREHPQALQRLPLYHIANYLGIAPKSLSRIRNKKPFA